MPTSTVDTLSTTQIEDLQETDLTRYVGHKVLAMTSKPDGNIQYAGRSVVGTLEAVTIDYSSPQRKVILAMRGTTLVLQGTSGHRPSDSLDLTVLDA